MPNYVTTKLVASDAVIQHLFFGYLHSMGFAKEEWGTMWNAYQTHVEGDMLSFDTAFAHPDPVIKALSERFPHEVIKVAYAGEDIGVNCGYYTIQNGDILHSDIAPNYSAMTAEEDRKWTMFTCKVKGLDPEDYLEDPLALEDSDQDAQQTPYF